MGTRSYLPTPEEPLYKAILYKGPPDHATPLYLVTCCEGWRESIVCEGMYKWAADWLVDQLQGKPYAPEQRLEEQADGQ